MRRRIISSVGGAAGVLALVLFFFYPFSRAAGALLSPSAAGAFIAAYSNQLESAATKRGYMAYPDIPTCLAEGVVSVEDKRFFAHGGIDPLAIVRAALESYQNDREDHGGSTISQQLARMILRTPRMQPSFIAAAESQLRIARATLILEHEFSKQKILELYLNSTYFGRGAYGPAAAAHAYFGKNLAELSEGQCLYLAGLPQAPTLFGEDPQGPYAQSRYLHVIATMQRNGYLTPQQASDLKQEQLFRR